MINQEVYIKKSDIVNNSHHKFPEPIVTPSYGFIFIILLFVVKKDKEKQNIAFFVNTEKYIFKIVGN